jgi:hypothetical protein
MAKFRHSFCCWLFIATVFISVVRAQPSPKVQKRIDKAIKDAANKTNLDYTAFVRSLEQDRPMEMFGESFDFSDARRGLSRSTVLVLQCLLEW